MPLPHRISAGALVIHEDRVLLVQHRIPGHDDFWVPPGGGAEGAESLMDCAVRECFEETGLRVQAHNIVYVEEFFDAGRRICKHWIHCELVSGEINFSHATEEERDVLLEARFVSRSEIAALNVFPRLMRDQFWGDHAAGFPAIRYIGFVS
ncbi:MAG: NUDIX hydrolase [Cephaloticoccus sp.]|nr:NUDIX hydrolase [Cephaloticoccus sp.]MCF7761224.1 NUDIX hydrolase [Cephaloticoccus sp.]